MALDRRRPRRPRAPIAAVALVLAIALGSSAVWVAAARAPLADGHSNWWPGLGAVPTR